MRECSCERILLSAEVPGNESSRAISLRGAKIPGSEKARERKGQGAIVPGSELARVAREQKGCESPTSHPRPTQPSIPPGSVNEYQLGWEGQRHVGLCFIPLVDEHGDAGKTVRSLENTWHRLPERLRGVFMTRRCTNPRLQLTLPYLTSAK